MRTPLGMLKAILALGEDHEGDIIVPGPLSPEDMVKEMRAIVCRAEIEGEK